MNKLLIIIDMQNDFIDGSLANVEAQKIVPGIVNLLHNWNGDVIVTRDTHQEEYLDTQEGKYLPIKHCIENTEGWAINSDILHALPVTRTEVLDKPTFGSLALITDAPIYDEIYLCGTCTDICVISNALILKAAVQETPIKVFGNLCAGSTIEKHKEALDVMKSCQIEVI